MSVVRKVGDVSQLPETPFGPAALTWWGMLGMMLIEGVTLVLVAAAYVYLRQNFYEWPPAPNQKPSLVVPFVALGLLLVSLLPARAAARRARAHDAHGVAVALILQSLFGIAVMVLRCFECLALHVRWDTNAYGSVAWAVLIAHAVVMVTDVMDTIGLTLVFLLTKPEEKHFVDTVENSTFWYFIVASWIPLFALVFLYPRLG
jgi:cytochrome c oxidase subunit I+III